MSNNITTTVTTNATKCEEENRMMDNSTGWERKARGTLLNTNINPEMRTTTY